MKTIIAQFTVYNTTDLHQQFKDWLEYYKTLATYPRDLEPEIRGWLIETTIDNSDRTTTGDLLTDGFIGYNKMPRIDLFSEFLDHASNLYDDQAEFLDLLNNIAGVQKPSTFEQFQATRKYTRDLSTIIPCLETEFIPGYFYIYNEETYYIQRLREEDKPFCVIVCNQQTAGTLEECELWLFKQISGTNA